MIRWLRAFACIHLTAKYPGVLSGAWSPHPPAYGDGQYSPFPVWVDLAQDYIGKVADSCSC